MQTRSENAHSVARALERIGIRGLIARGGVDVNLIGDVSGNDNESPETYVANTATFTNRWNGAAGGRIRTESAIQTTWLASPELADAVGAYMQTAAVGLHAHCAETQAVVHHFAIDTASMRSNSSINIVCSAQPPNSCTRSG